MKRGRSESRKRDALAALRTQLVDLFPDGLSLTNHQIEGFVALSSVVATACKIVCGHSKGADRPAG